MLKASSNNNIQDRIVFMRCSINTGHALDGALLGILTNFITTCRLY